MAGHLASLLPQPIWFGTYDPFNRHKCDCEVFCVCALDFACLLGREGTEVGFSRTVASSLEVVRPLCSDNTHTHFCIFTSSSSP